MALHFDNRIQAYKYIEAGDSNSMTQRKYTNALRDLQSRTNDPIEKQKIQWEIASMEFMLDSGEVSPMMEGTNKQGEIVTYPSYNTFTTDTYAYIKERADTTKNPHLSARFNQLLWNRPNDRHEMHAKRAIDAYLEALTLVSKSDDNSQYCILEEFRNGVHLSSKLNYRFSEFIDLLQSDKPFRDDWKPLAYNSLIGVKRVKKGHFDEAINICKDFVKELQKKGKNSEAERYLNIALSIAKRRNEALEPIHDLLADNYERMADDRMDDSTKMIPHEFLTKALAHYKEAGNKGREANVAIRLEEIRKLVKLSSFTTELSTGESKKIFEIYSKKANKLLELEPGAIYSYIADGRDLFPDLKTMESEINSQERLLMDTLSKRYFDINNNSSRSGTTEEEKVQEKIYFNFHIHVSFTCFYLQLLFFRGIQRGKLSFESIVNFLHKHSWLGQTFEEPRDGGEVRRYTWIGLIAPAFHYYFKQTEASILSTGYPANYVLVVDSLSLKFEGILRDFARLLKVQTVVYDRHKGGAREMYIEELLQNEVVGKHFDQNDRLLFNYIFTARGNNLRNNVAHCFMRFPDYNINQVHLLIVALLRLGKYRLTPKKSKYAR